MGLTISVYKHDSFDIGYFGFMGFRLEVAQARSEELFELYKRWAFGWLDYAPEKPLSDAEFERFKEIGGDLLIFLTHKDTDGSFTPAESRKIYHAIKNLKVDYEITEYHAQQSFNVLERLKDMFLCSFKKRRKVIFN